MNTSQHIGDIIRRVENIIRIGMIKSVNHAEARCTVDFQGIETTALAWLNLRAGNDVVWDAPTIGEQCVVLSPSGELANGIVIVGLYSQHHPAPQQQAHIKSRHFEDGAIVKYDTQQHQLTAILPKDGTAVITASGGITLNGDTTINGNATITGTTHSNGNISSDGDVNASGISLKTHTHNGVRSGGDSTGQPQ